MSQPVKSHAKKKRRKGPTLVPLRQVPHLACIVCRSPAPLCTVAVWPARLHLASPCSQALINLSKTSCNGQLEGQFAILDVDHDTAHLYQSCDIGDMHPSTINPEVKQSTGCMMTSAWLASGCSVKVDELLSGAEAHLRRLHPVAFCFS